MARLRFIGDVHGEYPLYRRAIEGADYTLQVGDLGLSYGEIADIEPPSHVAIAGNHDCYEPASPDYVGRQERFLGDFGTWIPDGLPPIFFVRGAWSIDHEWRRKRMAAGGDPIWWEAEQLDEEGLRAAEFLYRQLRPKIVVTHECPFDVIGYMGLDPSFPRRFGYDGNAIETRTNNALQAMWDAHSPRLWVFGHYHRRWEATIDGTRFVCLDMLGGDSGMDGAVFDLPEEFHR